MTLTKKYTIKKDNKELQKGTFKHDDELKQTINYFCEKEFEESIDYDYSELEENSELYIEYEEEILIIKVTNELDKDEELRDQLIDSSLKSHSAKTTDTIYISIPDDCTEFNNAEKLRISDHDANVRNQRNSGNIEIDIDKIDNVSEFIEDVEFAFQFDDASYISPYIFY